MTKLVFLFLGLLSSFSTVSAVDLVTCKFTIDNVVTQVYYNGVDVLSTVSGDLGDWYQAKELSFDFVPGAVLAISGKTESLSDDGAGTCNSDGLLLQCESTGVNVWSNFKSKRNSPTVVAHGWPTDVSPANWYLATCETEFTQPCESASGFYCPEIDPSADKLWGGDNYSWFRFDPSLCPTLISDGVNSWCDEPCPPNSSGYSLHSLGSSCECDDQYEQTDFEQGMICVPILQTNSPTLSPTTSPTLSPTSGTPIGGVEGEEEAKEDEEVPVPDSDPTNHFTLAASIGMVVGVIAAIALVVGGSSRVFRIYKEIKQRQQDLSKNQDDERRPLSPKKPNGEPIDYFDGAV